MDSPGVSPKPGILTRPLSRICRTAAVVVPLLMVQPVVAQTTGGSGETVTWFAEVFGKIRSPWFWFGMTAQFVFFMRFVVQWIVSERRRRSTVPIAFWYLSLAGSLALFVYAAHERDPVIMAGQLLACVIYVRNLMLISDWQKRRRRAGLPADEEEETDEARLPRGKPAR